MSVWITIWRLTYVEHVESVVQAVVTDTNRPLNLLALQVTLDEWAVILPLEELIYIVKRSAQIVSLK